MAPITPPSSALIRFQQNEDRYDDFVNGSDTATFETRDGEEVPSIRKFLKDNSEDIEHAVEVADSLPAIDDQKMLVDVEGSRLSKTFAQVREYLEVIKTTGATALNHLAVGKADGSFGVVSRNAAKAPGALGLMGFEDGKMSIGGLRPDRLTSSILRIQPGVCADGAAAPSDSMYLPIVCDIDTTKVGVRYQENPANAPFTARWEGGMDVGAPVAGTGYFLYMVKNPTNGAVACILSKEISISLVTMPPGFTLIRKLPWGFIWSDGATAAGNSAGIPLFHLSHWPHPETMYTDSSPDASWAVLTAGVATTLAAGSINVSRFVPDNARIVTLCCVLTGTTAGEAYIRSTGSGLLGKIVGSISASGQKSIQRVKVRPSSAFLLNYRVSVDTVNLSCYVEAYDQTEVS